MTSLRRRRSRVLLGLLGLTALLSAAPACADPAKAEAASLLAAVDRFRRAEYPGKASMLPPLREVACTDRDVCATKDACIAHAEPLVAAIAMKSEVQRKMDDPEAGILDPDTRAALIAKLDDASKLLDKGRAAQAACDQKTIELRMRYRL